MALLRQSIQGIQNLAHEGTAARHNSTDEDHLSREPLQLFLLHSLSAFNVPHLL
jgi:hypothetical protein